MTPVRATPLSASPHWTASRAIRIFSWIVAAVILSGAALARLSVRPLAMFDPDTWGYLHPAVTLASGEGFQTAHGRNWPYPVFLAAIFSLGGNFEAIVRAQQACGLLAGMLMWLAMEQFLPTLRSGLVVESCGRLLSATGLALFLFNSENLFLEISIRPESISPLFAFANICCVLRFLCSRWAMASDASPGATGARLSASILWGGLSLALTYFNFLLKPNWGFAAGAAALPIVAGLVSPAPALLKAAPAAAGLLLCGLLALAPRALGAKPDPMGRLFLPVTLLSVHAGTILPVLEEEAARDPSGAGIPSAFLVAFRNELQTATAKPGAFVILGHDADHLMYRTKVLWNLRLEPGWNDARFAAFCRNAYLEAWISQPGLMAGKVLRQLRVFLWPSQETFLPSPAPIGRGYQRAINCLPIVHATAAPHLRQAEAGYVAAITAVSKKEKLQSPKALKPIAALFVILAWLAPAFLALGWLLSIQRTPHRLAAGWMASIVWLTVFGNVLTVAVIHSFDIERYLHSLTPINILACQMAAVFFAQSVTSVTRPKS